MKLMQKICGIATAAIFIVRFSIQLCCIFSSLSWLGRGVVIITFLVPIICLCFYIDPIRKGILGVSPLAEKVAACG